MLQKPQEPLRTGTLLGGRYRVQLRIAAGAMGSVWRCTDEHLQGRPLAVKTFCIAPGENADEARAQFERECQVAI